MSAEFLWALHDLHQATGGQLPSREVDEPRALRLTRRDALLLVALLASLPLGGWLFFQLVGAVFCLEGSGFSYLNPRPGNPYVAQVHSRNCGATTDYYTWVTVRAGRGKEYSPFRGDRAAVFAGELDPKAITLKWESPTVLAIEYPGREGARVSKMIAAWKELTIIHRPR
jgi:hypothetical protein